MFWTGGNVEKSQFMIVGVMKETKKRLVTMTGVSTRHSPI